MDSFPVDPVTGAVRDADVLPLSDGTLLAFFTPDVDVAEPGGFILLCRSTNKPRSWSGPDTVVQTTLPCFSPFALQLRDGLLLVVFSLSNPDPVRSVGKTGGVFMVTSYDYGETFGVPRMVKSEGSGRIRLTGRPVELPDGRIVLPVMTGSGDESAAAVIFSEDRGLTWGVSVPVAPAGQYVNPKLIQIPGSGILCILESAAAGDPVFRTLSPDMGRTWSIPRSTNLFGKRPEVLRTPDGSLMCALVKEWPRGLAISYSYDNGMTWAGEWTAVEGDFDDSPLALFAAGKARYGLVFKDKNSRDGYPVLRGIRFYSEPLDPPGGISVSVTKGAARFRWNQMPEAAYYLVFRNDSAAFDPVLLFPPAGNLLATPGDAKFTDTGLDSGQVAWYRIAAVKSRGPLLKGTGNMGAVSEVIQVRGK